MTPRISAGLFLNKLPPNPISPNMSLHYLKEMTGSCLSTANSVEGQLERSIEEGFGSTIRRHCNPQFREGPGSRTAPGSLSADSRSLSSTSEERLPLSPSARSFSNTAPTQFGFPASSAITAYTAQLQRPQDLTPVTPRFNPLPGEGGAGANPRQVANPGVEGETAVTHPNYDPESGDPPKSHWLTAWVNPLGNSPKKSATKKKADPIGDDLC